MAELSESERRFLREMSETLKSQKQGRPQKNQSRIFDLLCMKLDGVEKAAERLANGEAPEAVLGESGLEQQITSVEIDKIFREEDEESQ